MSVNTPSPRSSEVTESTVRLNAERDPGYCPWCLRCTGLVRMKKVETLFWRCASCGAEHDERESGSGPVEARGSDEPRLVVEDAVEVGTTREQIEHAAEDITTVIERQYVSQLAAIDLEDIAARLRTLASSLQASRDIERERDLWRSWWEREHGESNADGVTRLGPSFYQHPRVASPRQLAIFEKELAQSGGIPRETPSEETQVVGRVRCSFCGRAKDAGFRLVEGGAKARICETCVADVLEQFRRDDARHVHVMGSGALVPDAFEIVDKEGRTVMFDSTAEPPQLADLNAVGLNRPYKVIPLYRASRSHSEPEPSARAIPKADWHDDDGAVLWWNKARGEPPHVGSPLDTDWADHEAYYTHFTRIPNPIFAAAPAVVETGTPDDAREIVQQHHAMQIEVFGYGPPLCPCGTCAGYRESIAPPATPVSTENER